MRPAPVPSLIAALVVPLLLAGCGADGADGPAKKDAPATASSKVSDEPLDGDYTQPGLAQDASVPDFCKAMAEVDTAIDDAQTPAGDPADAWLRIVTAIDAVWETGVPSSLPAAGTAEITHIDRLIRQSNSVREFNDAVRADPPKGRAVDTWLSSNCK